MRTMAIPYPHLLGSDNSPMENGFLGPPQSPPPASPSPSSLPTPCVVLTQDDLKRMAAYKAVDYVRSGMVIGLGTGSTARHAVDRIADLIHQGKLSGIVGVPTSSQTHQQALSLGIPLSDLDSHPTLDLAIHLFKRRSRRFRFPLGDNEPPRRGRRMRRESGRPCMRRICSGPRRRRRS